MSGVAVHVLPHAFGGASLNVNAMRIDHMANPGRQAYAQSRDHDQHQRLPPDQPAANFGFFQVQHGLSIANKDTHSIAIIRRRAISIHQKSGIPVTVGVKSVHNRWMPGGGGTV